MSTYNICLCEEIRKITTQFDWKKCLLKSYVFFFFFFFFFFFCSFFVRVSDDLSL